jgi:thiamine kinase-like enzyme
MGLLDRIQSKASTARIRAHMMWEETADRRPKRLAEVPRSVDVITREWLSAALCRRVPGAQVLDFDLGALNVGTTSRRAIHVRYNEAGQRAGLQERIFGKATPQFTTRLVCGPSGAIASEVNFYNKVRSLLAIETLDCHYAAFDPGSFRSILVFDDISYTKQAQFLDPHHRFTRPQAESIMVLLAALHSTFWGSPMLDRDFTWLKDSLRYQHHINRVIQFEERALIGVDRTADILPVAIRDRRRELWPALMRSCALRVADTHTLLHADIHPGNWYLAANGALGLTDWQCTVKGQWAADFAYALSSCLDIEDRRAWERELLCLYLGELRLPAGQAVPTFDRAWLAYRQQTLHGLFNWLFVAGAGPMQPSMQPQDFGRINLERMGAAVADLETLDCLGAD